MLASTVFKKTKGTGSAYNKALKTTPFGRSDAFTRGGFAMMPHATAPLSLMLCFSKTMRKILVGILLLISWNIMASYSLHIERDNQISVGEWLAICESDSSLTVQHVAKAINPETGETIEIQTPNGCVWTSPILRRKYYFC
ncbi:hypothetical protein ambt_06410 [Alteromonas naphthalenivorans]|uniref:Uncharacterized protein n=2 Tax=Alteromonas naphthalenivorans TaxID=715451 RepID=F5ZCS0_ALTNA|nr:hypothetical protein ambt_06410 [Alteromonas naphthalenivorans]